MDITEVLQFAESLILAKTGKDPDYLQKAILRGTLQGHKYSQIAEYTYVSERHVRGVGSELWKILSEASGENITKANFRAILEKGQFFSVSSSIGRDVGGDFVTINNVSICPETSRSPTDTQQPQPNPAQLHLDLGDAPEIFSFYDRTDELSTLERWIVRDRTRLIALLGISGIGKTTLAIRLIDQIKTHFDYIIYRRLRFSPTLNATLINLLQIFSCKPDTPHSIETLLSQLLNNLRNNRCLIVLDDVQMLFSSGQLAGQYKSGYEDYHLFFKDIAEVCHNSCLMLNSSEKLREFDQLEKENHPVRSFVLGTLGVAAKEILRKQKLSNEETWETLINTYQGNPLWLELTATMIHELFGGRVSEFLQYDPRVLCESLHAQLDQHFQRLTHQERAVMTQLANEPEPVALPQISKSIPLSPSELLNAMQSLGRRLLLETKEQGKATFFTQSPVWKQYVKNRER